METRRAWNDSFDDLGEPVANEQLARLTDLKHTDQDNAGEVRQPFFVDIMCGVNAPMARTMAWCGWQTETFDKARGRDLTDSAVAAQASSAVSRSQAYWIAITCTTLSRAREKPLADGSTGPRPLRSVASLGHTCRADGPAIF